MTLFRKPLGTCRNSDDLRVIIVGVVCTVLIFSFVSAYEGHHGGNPAIYVDLVQEK